MPGIVTDGYEDTEDDVQWRRKKIRQSFILPITSLIESEFLFQVGGYEEAFTSKSVLLMTGGI